MTRTLHTQYDAGVHGPVTKMDRTGADRVYSADVLRPTAGPHTGCVVLA